MNEPQIQFPQLPLSEVNMLLEGLKLMPLGQVYGLFTKLHAESQKQMQPQAVPTAPPPAA